MSKRPIVTAGRDENDAPVIRIATTATLPNGQSVPVNIVLPSCEACRMAGTILDLCDCAKVGCQ